MKHSQVQKSWALGRWHRSPRASPPGLLTLPGRSPSPAAPARPARRAESSKRCLPSEPPTRRAQFPSRTLPKLTPADF